VDTKLADHRLATDRRPLTGDAKRKAVSQAIAENLDRLESLADHLAYGIKSTARLAAELERLS
jgi:hypothetical protein